MPLYYTTSHMRLVGDEARQKASLFQGGTLRAPVTFTRAQSPTDARATALASDGVTWQGYAADIARLHGAGRPLLLEGASTNHNRNPACVGAVSGTMGSGGAVPTHWTDRIVSGASSQMGGLTVVITTIPAADGVDLVRVRCHGTATATAASLDFEIATQTEAAPSQWWSTSFFARLIDATLPPLNYRSRLVGRTAAGAVVASNTFLNNLALTSSVQRFAYSSQLTSAGTIARVSNGIQFQLTSGQDYDFTVDVGWPQLEQGTFTSTPMLPVAAGAAVATRGADIATWLLSDLDLASEDLVLKVTATLPTAVLSEDRTIFAVHDASADNLVAVVSKAGTDTLVIRRVAATVALESDPITYVPDVPFRVVFWVDGTTAYMAWNAGDPVSVAGVPGDLTTLQLGAQYGEAAPMFGTIKSVETSRWMAPAEALPTQSDILLDPQYIEDRGGFSGVLSVRNPDYRRFVYEANGDPAEDTSEHRTYATRTDRTDPAHMRINGAEVDILYAYGQSWMSRDEAIADGSVVWSDVVEDGTIFALGKSTGGYGGAYGHSAQGTLNVIDLRSIPINAVFARLALCTAYAWQRLRRRYAPASVRPIVVLCYAVPGGVWSDDPETDELSPDAPILDATATNYWGKGEAFADLALEYLALYGMTVGSVANIYSQGPNSDVEAEELVFREAYVTASEARIDTLFGASVPRTYVTDMGARKSDQATASPGSLAHLAHAVGSGGTVALAAPRYLFPFYDEIHHTGEASARLSELYGLALLRRLDLGVAWESLRVLSVAVSGSTVTITTTQPEAAGVLALETTYIEAAADYGFTVKVGGSPLTISSVVLGATSITLNMSAPIAPAEDVEVSYAWYGVAQTYPPATHSACWGNVVMRGPASVFWDDYTIDHPLCPFIETVVAA